MNDARTCAFGKPHILNVARMSKGLEPYCWRATGLPCLCDLPKAESPLNDSELPPNAPPPALGRCPYDDFKPSRDL